MLLLSSATVQRQRRGREREETTAIGPAVLPVVDAHASAAQTYMSLLTLRSLPCCCALMLLLRGTCTSSAQEISLCLARHLALILCRDALFAAGASSDSGLAAPPDVQPRALLSQGRHFVDPATGKPVQLRGGDVVMKGSPWIPLTTTIEQPQDAPVQGVSMGLHCDDRWFSNYTCTTFSAEDAKHFKSKGWNFVRLGVVWAGGQPTPEPRLDADFETRLHAFLDLCHEHGIHVLLDVHEDSVGAATCGEGVPQWFSALATPGQIGKPLSPLLGILNESFWVPENCHEKTFAVRLLCTSEVAAACSPSGAVPCRD